MNILRSLVPLVLFVVIYVGSSLYFVWQGVPNAFYQISPLVAILPALIVGWLFHQGSNKERMQSFLRGVAHHDIIAMCMIFLLAGAFSMVTKSIGSVDATVQMILTGIHPRFLLIGIFVGAAFIATAIGTSMGTIATLAPLVVGIAQQGAFSIELGLATVVGGAMFGDNISLISDTTIAAVMSQEADFTKKLKLNASVAAIAACITAVLLFFLHADTSTIQSSTPQYMLITPYLFLMALALCGVNVFVVLITALAYAGIVGFLSAHYSLLLFSKDITLGFNSMYEIMVLSMFVGGLSGLTSQHLQRVRLSEAFHWCVGKKMAQLCIAGIVSFFDILLANNTIAIILSGQMVKNIADQYAIPRHYSAAWLDIFSCVFQGIIPYGAQILLASSIGSVSPLAITIRVYYCYILAVVAIGYIIFRKGLQD